MQSLIDFKPTPIKDLVPQTQSVNCHFIVIEKGPAIGFRNATGDFTTLRVADPTGSINFNVLAGEYSEAVQPGDICKLKNGHTTIFKGAMSLQCGKNGDLFKMGEFTMVFSETPNMSEYNSDWAAQFPPKPRIPNDPNSTPMIGAPPRNSGQPIMNLLPPDVQHDGWSTSQRGRCQSLSSGPSSHGGQSSLPRDPRAAKRYHDPRTAARADQ